MTNLEITLTIMVWVLIACILARKWEKADSRYIEKGGHYVLCLCIMPIVLIWAIVRQTFFEDWK